MHTHTTHSLAARHAACLVYALAPATDRQLQDDVAYVAGETGVEDQLDVFDALDDLMFAAEGLAIEIARGADLERMTQRVWRPTGYMGA